MGRRLNFPEPSPEVIWTNWFLNVSNLLICNYSNPIMVSSKRKVEFSTS